MQDKIERVIVVKSIDTPLGSMLAGATAEGICVLWFAGTEGTERESIRKYFGAEIEESEGRYFDPLVLQLSEYFEGKRKNFDLPLVLCGTDFQKQVWRELLNIPYGQTRSYKQQSLAIKKPDAIRAVASANGANPIAIIIPCHRVIGEDGSLTGYGGGLWRKKWLLDLEKGQLTL
jgi:AraC family transcriptional regulator of adaptative response/methylated-DNA-[protein]-cysteine methyltransferase